MIVLKPTETLSEETKSIVAVGNFDGVHKGHRILIENVVRRAKEKACSSVLVTFEPHPRLVLNPNADFKILTTFEEKVKIIGNFGVDYLFRTQFTPEFGRQSPEEFIESVIIEKLHAVEWIMGEDHGIGKNRIGEKKLLHNLLYKYHINPFIIDRVELQKKIVSSTVIREKILNGCIAEAVKMLGHPFPVFTERTTGIKLASKLGFPTLNFKTPPSQKVLPPPGVYAAEMEFKGCVQPGALYLGRCPTFAEREIHFEFHAFNSADVFPEVGETACLLIHGFIRKELSFPAAEDFVKQIVKDIESVKNFMKEKGRCH